MKHRYMIGFVFVLMLLTIGCSSKASHTSQTEQDRNRKDESQDTVSGDEVIRDKSTEVNGIKELEQGEPLQMIEDNNRIYYEIFVGSFYDSNGDGIGDLQGVISKLDYLKDEDDTTDHDLGINGIWLMPIHPSPSYHKYDVTDYYNIDPEYGTREDFIQLLEECKKRKIRLIMDLVLNHTSNQHPWFAKAVEYLTSLKKGQEIDPSECKYVDYYNFSKDYTDKKGWYRVNNTDWYYEGVFSDHMPDLNLDSKDVRREIQKIAEYWIKLGVEGFRLDAAKEYYSGNHNKNVEFLKWFQEYVKTVNQECYLVAEVWDTIGTIAQYYESGIDSIFNYYYGGPDGKIANLVNQYGKKRSGKSLSKIIKSMQDTLSARNPNYIDAPFLSNHDNDRCISYVSGNLDKMKLMAGINLIMNGSPFLYYGEEIGMSGSGRDENKRGPMIWSENDTVGMTKGPKEMQAQPLLFGAVDEQVKLEDSLLNYYKNAIRLRNQNPELARGKVTVPDGIKDGDICAITKEYKGSVITIIINVSQEDKKIDLAQLHMEDKKIKGYLKIVNTPSIQDNQLILTPMSIVIIK